MTLQALVLKGLAFFDFDLYIVLYMKKEVQHFILRSHFKAWLVKNTITIKQFLNYEMRRGS